MKHTNSSVVIIANLAVILAIFASTVVILLKILKDRSWKRNMQNSDYLM